MQKAAKVATAIIATTVFILSLYLVNLGLVNNPPVNQFTAEKFFTHRMYVTTGPTAGLGIIRVEYTGIETLPGNLTIQAQYKDTGEIVVREISVTDIEPNWRKEFTVTKPSTEKVVITLTYNGESISLIV